MATVSQPLGMICFSMHLPNLVPEVLTVACECSSQTKARAFGSRASIFALQLKPFTGKVPGALDTEKILLQSIKNLIPSSYECVYLYANAALLEKNVRMEYGTVKTYDAHHSPEDQDGGVSSSPSVPHSVAEGPLLHSCQICDRKRGLLFLRFLKPLHFVE